MSYAIPPITDKRVKSQLLFKAHHQVERGVPRSELAAWLKYWVGLYAAETKRQWRGQPDAEQAIIDEPANQEWINAMVQEALEGAEALQAQING
jgi:hypothetical protein